LEKRIIHNSASGEPILSLPAEPESAPSEESEVPIPTNIPTAEMSAEEIRQLDELMRNQVNEMLQDILAERRRTTGLWDEEIDGKGDVKSVIAEETDSEDSFEEKYVRYSGETEKMAKKAETEEVAKETETEDELYADSEVEEENEEVNNGENEEKTEENDVKIEEKEDLNIEEAKTGQPEIIESTPEHCSPFQHADASVMEMMLQQPLDDFFDDEDESSITVTNELTDTEHNVSSQPIESNESVPVTNEPSQTIEVTESNLTTTANEPGVTTEPVKSSEEEPKKEKPSTGFWCRV